MSSFIRGKTISPFKACFYGTGGVGKSTLASLAPNPLFLDFEGGIDNIDCVKTPLITDIDQMMPYIQEGIEEGFETFVFDTADSIEILLSKKVCEKHKVDNIADLDWGKGFEALRMRWNKLIDVFDILKAKGKNTILIAHDFVQKYDDPRNDGYDRVTLKMHTKSADTVIARMDAILYMTYDMVVSKDARGKGKAKGNGSRVIYTDERPAFAAKNRYGMPFRLNNPADVYNFLSPTPAKEEGAE